MPRTNNEITSAGPRPAEPLGPSGEVRPQQRRCAAHGEHHAQHARLEADIVHQIEEEDHADDARSHHQHRVCARERPQQRRMPDQRHALPRLAEDVLAFVGRRGRRLNRADTPHKEGRREEASASMRIAPGPLMSCTSQPAALKLANSATEALACSLALPSTSSSRSTSVGRYASYATSKNVVSVAATTATVQSCTNVSTSKTAAMGNRYEHREAPISAAMRIGRRCRRSTQTPANSPTTKPGAIEHAPSTASAPRSNAATARR